MLGTRLDMAYAIISKNQAWPSWNSIGKCLWYIVKRKRKLRGFGNYKPIFVHLESVCIEN